MPEKKKYGILKKTFKDIFSKKLKENNLTKQNTDLPKNDLAEQIKKAVENLYYLSETDAEITLFIGGTAESVGKDVILSQTESAADAPVEERDFTQFFERLTAIQDWFGDEETETANKYARLKELLENNLRDLKVFKIGKIQLDIYAVGLDAENNLMGIKTKAVET